MTIKTILQESLKVFTHTLAMVTLYRTSQVASNMYQLRQNSKNSFLIKRYKSDWMVQINQFLESDNVYTLSDGSYRYYSAKEISKNQRKASLENSVATELKGIYEDKEVIVSITRMIYLNQKDLQITIELNNCCCQSS